MDWNSEATKKHIAEAVGLTLLGPGKNKHYRLYRFNVCGHKQEITTDHVRRDGFLCNQCEETSLGLPNHVYLLDIQVGEEN